MSLVGQGLSRPRADPRWRARGIDEAQASPHKEAGVSPRFESLLYRDLRTTVGLSSTSSICLIISRIRVQSRFLNKRFLPVAS